MDSQLLLFILVGTLASVTMGQFNPRSQCTERNFIKCTQQLENHEADQDTLFPSASEAEIKSLCNHYETAKTCMEPILADCQDGEEIHWEEAVTLIRYICEDHLKDYLQHRNCLGGSQLKQDGQKCNNTMHNEMLNLTSIPHPKDMEDHESVVQWHKMITAIMCRIINKYLSCILGVAQQHCGSVAAAWVERLLQLELELVQESEFFNCLLTTKGSTTKRTTTMTLPGTTRTTIIPKIITTLATTTKTLPLPIVPGVTSTTTRKPTARPGHGSTTTQKSVDPNAGRSEQKKGAPVTYIVGGILGTILVIALVVVVLVYVFVCRRRRKPTEQPVSYIQPTNGQDNPIYGITPADSNIRGMENPLYMANNVVSPVPTAPPAYSGLPFGKGEPTANTNIYEKLSDKR